MTFKVFALVAVFAVAYSKPSTLPTSYNYQEGPAKYDFNWAVNDDQSGNFFGQQEVRDGDSTKGSYYVRLPDSRLQKVTYYVTGDSGFVADVTYEGEAVFPEQPQASYY